jgi:hypothetical protein
MTEWWNRNPQLQHSRIQVAIRHLIATIAVQRSHGNTQKSLVQPAEQILRRVACVGVLSRGDSNSSDSDRRRRRKEVPGGLVCVATSKNTYWTDIPSVPIVRHRTENVKFDADLFGSPVPRSPKPESDSKLFKPDLEGKGLR